MKSGTESKLKFAKLKRRLQLSHWQTVGLLESLWMFTCQNCPEGDVGRFSNEDLAAAIEWSGDHDDLIQALVECNWLDPADPPYRLVVHDWQEHCPVWVRGVLKRHKRSFAVSTKGTTKGCPNSKALKESPNTEPLPILFNSILFNSKQLPKGSCLSRPSGVTPNSGDTFGFPLKSGKTWYLTEIKFQEYLDSHSQLDVAAELRKARQWLRDNPDRRKTARGMPAFLTGWLNRAGDKGKSKPTGAIERMRQKDLGDEAQ